MKYISTRGKAPSLTFDDVLLAGLARDGGLYVPESWPQFDTDAMRAMQGMSYTDVAQTVMQPFVGESISPDELAAIIRDTYAGFDCADVAPLKDLGDNLYLLELFHGPTLAFKDYALQFLGRMFDHVLNKRGEKLTIVGATSGDTGSAAIEACRDRDAIEIFILHPEGRVSDVQRRQMTTIMSDNVHNIAVEGTFDDCQSMVKSLFNDEGFRDRVNLSAVNSINWVRILAQIVYYFWAATRLGAPDKPVSFAVPTGNFGNVFAGYCAYRCGLPIRQLVIGSNANDILYRFVETGRMEMVGVQPTISPSMDIQISSNFERLLFEMTDRSADDVSNIMHGFAKDGVFDVTPALLESVRALISAARFDDAQTKDVIRDTYAKCGELLDPHSAIGVGAALSKRLDTDTPIIALATAHPAKFPDAVKEASGQHPALPAHLADLLSREEKRDILPNDLQKVRAFILDTLQERHKL